MIAKVARRGVLVIFAVALSLVWARGDNPLGELDLKLEEDLPYRIDAPSMQMDKDSGWGQGEGGVTITRGDQVLKADKVRVNINTGDVVADGNVELRRGTDVWKGETLKYNFRTRVGIAENFDLKFGPVAVEAGKGGRDGEGLYSLEQVKVTTCGNDHPHKCWHYHMKAKRVEVDPEEYLKAWGGLLYLGKVPVMYVPYWYRDLDGEYGLTMEPGYESRHGFMLLNSYRYRFANGLRARTHLDYRSKRGLGGGQDVTWEDESIGNGRLRLYYLYDQKEMDEADPLYDEVDENRGRVRFEHRVDPTERDTVRAFVHWLSDAALLEDFFENEFRESRQPENQLSWNRWGELVNYGVVGRFRVNDFYDTVQRLPEAWLTVNRVEMGESQVFYETKSEAAYLEHLMSSLEDDPQDDYSTFRADTWHQFNRPSKLGAFNVMPVAGARATYYADTLERESVLVPGGVDDFGVSYGASTNDVYTSAGADLRMIFDIGIETSLKAFKIWDSASGPRRHVAEPYIAYRLRPEPNVTPDELYQFDEIDDVDEDNRMRLGVRNKLQRKVGGRSWTTMDLDLWGDALFATDEGQDTLDSLGMRARIRPSKWVAIESDALYSASYSGLEEFNARLRFWQKVMDADVEYRYWDRDVLGVDISSLVDGHLTFRANEAWSFQLFGRYEFEEQRVETEGGYVQLGLDCLTFRVTGKVEPGYTRDDGSEAEDDYKVLFQMWVNAFQKVGS